MRELLTLAHASSIPPTHIPLGYISLVWVESTGGGGP